MNEISLFEMREIDLNAYFLNKEPLELMENAGRACFEEIEKIVEKMNKKKLRITILCGLGNNGGDGFVLARYLAEKGYDVHIILAGSSEKIKTEESRINFKRLLKYKNVRIYEESYPEDVLNSDIIVDALLGTGIKGHLKGKIRELVEKANKSKGIKVSIDVPTGIGTELFFKADFVITFHKMKKELKDFRVIVKDIGIPKIADEIYFYGNAILDLPIRDEYSHKGQNGKILIIGGSRKYHGAINLAAIAALAGGCDLVYILAPKVIESSIRNNYEVIPLIYEGEFLNEKALELFNEIYSKVDVILIGNGLGYNKEIERIVREMLSIAMGKVPIVIDADAIKCVRGMKMKNCIITPHSKEFEIFSGVKIEDEIEDRKKKVIEVSKRNSCIILLKGRHDIISDGNRLKINITGNSGMTVGGTGDVLSGLVSSFISQGVEPFKAACLASFVNGLAGDLLLKKYGYSYTAMDLIVKIKEVINFLYKMRWKIIKR